MGLNSGAIQGMQQAEAHAEAVSPEWRLRAALALRQYILAFPGKTFIAPVVRKWAEQHGLDAPPSNMAWGSVFLRASKMGMIKAVGYEQYGDEVMHTQSVRQWIAGGA